MDEYIKTATVLYVEDEESIREGYSKPILKCAKELYTASNGEEGLEFFKTYAPDIIVTDIKMPKMNGIDMVKAIKEIEPDVRVIFTTAHSESEYLFNALEIHADSYLIKPVRSRLLKNKILSLSKIISLEKINAAQQKRILEQEKLLQNIIDIDKNISIVTDFNRISFANNAFLEFFEIENIEQFYKKHNCSLDILNQEEGFLHQGLLNTGSEITENKELGKKFYELVQTTDEAKRVVSVLDSSLQRKYFFINISVMDEEKGLYLLNLTNITGITRQNADIQKKAYTDELTGAHNRNKFKEVLKHEISKCDRYNYYKLSFAMFDIDHFKQCNDKYGHLVGDEVLTKLVKKVKHNIRESDLLVRWGGEEFIILFVGVAIAEAVKAANILRTKIEKQEHKTVGRITVSFGVTEYKNGDNEETILKRCDEALYLAKENGRNSVRSL